MAPPKTPTRVRSKGGLSPGEPNGAGEHVGRTETELGRRGETQGARATRNDEPDSCPGAVIGLGLRVGVTPADPDCGTQGGDDDPVFTRTGES